MDTSQKLSHYRYLAMLFPVLMLLLLGGWAGSAAVLAQWEATAVPTVTNPVATQPPQPGVLQINWEALLAFVNRPDVRSILNVLVPVVTVILTVLGIFNTKFISMDKHIHEAKERAIEASAKSSEASANARQAIEIVERSSSQAGSSAAQIKQLEAQVNELRAESRSFFSDIARQRVQQVSLREAYPAFDRGEISRREFIDYQQIRYWYKWRNLHNELGFQELLESAKQDNGLYPAARLMVQVELDRLAEHEQDGYLLSDRDQTLRRQLTDLLKASRLLNS